MFGGQDVGNTTLQLSDTWEYDGTQWLPQAPATPPLPPNHALRGLLVYGQGGVLDPAAPGGLALSAALRLSVDD